MLNLPLLDNITLNSEFQIDNIPNQQLITHPNIWIKREDLIHQHVSGNKFRKLIYNLHSAKQIQADAIITFGGAYSNHIAATAAAGKLWGIKSIGIIRGDELANQQSIEQNPTLQFATENGMHLHFLSREQYRMRADKDFLNELNQRISEQFQITNPYFIPEGGTNSLAIKGCETILTEEDNQFDIIACAVGTGGTLSGLINSAKTHQTVLGFPALKDEYLTSEISRLINSKIQCDWQLIHDYHFGGYGKVPDELVKFINQFNASNSLKLDPIYTGKLLFGVIDMLEKKLLDPNKKILVIHTGGLQGIEGINTKLKTKNRDLII